MQNDILEETVQKWRLQNTTRTSDMTILLRRHLDHLSLSLRPLLSITTGAAHPAFPKTLLHYHLLTEEQLDSLAQFYHQKTPSVFSFDYPAPIVTRWDTSASIEDKRRRFGRFVGLRGCDSPEAAAMEDFDQYAMDRWVEERIRRNAARERTMENWRTKGC